MKHRIAVPDGFLNTDSPVPKYLTAIATTDSYAHAFAVGRMFAQRYGRAYLLHEDGQHIATAWRKADDTERPLEVVTGSWIPDSHDAVSMHDRTPREGAPGGGCPQCIAIELSLEGRRGQ